MNIKTAFKDKVLLITGGTGSFGNAVLNQFIKTNVKEIRIFSRDEKKQDDMRKKYNHSKIKFYIGDVRDFSSIQHVAEGTDYIFHAAALKQVPSCEFYPLEAVKTNVMGTENVLEAAILNKVKKVICLSTDKAVYPVNAMGISKALMEKVAIAKSRYSAKTDICITRYGNVIASRGSVVPLFVNQIIKNKPITITDKAMTRFVMTLQEAVDLVIHAFLKGKNGEIFIQQSKAADIQTIADSVKEIMNAPSHPIKIIGTRHGEKLYEVLMSREEMAASKEIGNYFHIKPDHRDLNYEMFYIKGEKSITNNTDYNSHSVKQLSTSDLIKVFKGTTFFKELLAKK